MSALPRISIVIPTLNAGAYLGQCLSSIQRQGYPNLEVLVIDGTSTDNTANVVDRYASVVTKFISEPDRGQPDAVTKGLRFASGDIAHWHAADDIILPGALHLVAAAFSSDPKLALVFSDGMAFDTQRVYAGAYVRFVDFWTTLLFFGRFQSDCTYWRHSLTHPALPLDGDKPLTCDEDFFLRLWAGKRHRWISEPLGAFRIRHEQLSERLPKSGLANDRADTRRRVSAALGITDAEARRLRTECRVKYLVGSRVAPKVYSAARFAIRKITFDCIRRRYTHWFLKEWLREVG